MNALLSEIALSLVVLSWNNLELTRRCVESLRRHTDVSSELIIVDNGSEDGGAEFARSAADIPVIHEENLGFAAGMNSGLAHATGDFVAFINNDTVFPSSWASRVLETFTTLPTAGIVMPAVTAAGNAVTVRRHEGTSRITFIPFAEFPSGVVSLMRTEIVKRLGGWNESYRTASAEDLDLAFTVWAHGLDIVLDERVLVDHVSQASVRRVPDRKSLYEENLNRFLDRWETRPLGDRPLIESVAPDLLAARQDQARVAVIWVRRMLKARDEARLLQVQLETAANTARTRRRSWFRSRS